ncbi:MAG: hypothetical protein EZS28_010790 [Streblomastix strix]|uniref:Uncharacterized protein n=1 Tax=Streblomastix strix TaxID=222440 RepID=A0A5J4WGC0_9EUKA|nr:MAG: hypothetical protein EZS28_010790 [Streblomastix strix]
MVYLNRHGYWPSLVDVNGPMKRCLYGLLTVQQNIITAQALLKNRNEMIMMIHPRTLPLIEVLLIEYEKQIAQCLYNINWGTSSSQDQLLNLGIMTENMKILIYRIGEKARECDGILLQIGKLILIDVESGVHTDDYDVLERLFHQCICSGCD